MLSQWNRQGWLEMSLGPCVGLKTHFKFSLVEGGIKLIRYVSIANNVIDDILPSLFYGRFYYFVLYNNFYCSIETPFPLFHSCTKGNLHSESRKHMAGFWRSYLKLMADIDTNYGKTTRIPNIPETGTLLKHGTDRKWEKIILKTAIKSFESCRFFWVVRLTANKQYFNLGLISTIYYHLAFYAQLNKVCEWKCRSLLNYSQNCLKGHLYIANHCL